MGELNKLLQKVYKRKLSIQADLEWEPLFEEQRGKAAALQADIQRVEVTRCDFELIEGNLSQVVSSIERFFPSVCEADELILKFRPKKPGIPSNYYYQRCAFVRSKE